MSTPATTLREAMVKTRVLDYTVRIWRAKPLDDIETNYWALKQWIDAIAFEPTASPNDVATRLLALDNVNAVEVLWPDGNGEVLYKDWP